MTDAERRENNRLRSERYRRAKGIPPRRPAQRPWLALDISKSTYYIGGAPRPASKPPWRWNPRVNANFSTARNISRRTLPATSRGARRSTQSWRGNLLPLSPLGSGSVRMSAKGGFLPVRLRAAMRGTGHSVPGRVRAERGTTALDERGTEAAIRVRSAIGSTRRKAEIKLTVPMMGVEPKRTSRGRWPAACGCSLCRAEESGVEIARLTAEL
jgi:hypothetical protein